MEGLTRFGRERERERWCESKTFNWNFIDIFLVLSSPIVWMNRNICKLVFSAKQTVESLRIYKFGVNVKISILKLNM